MRTRIASLIVVLMCLILSAAGAQQGHPLDGVWSGDWGPAAGERIPVVVELKWQNTTLSGNINPGSVIPLNEPSNFAFATGSVALSAIAAN